MKLLDLNNDVINYIIYFLDYNYLYILSETSKQFKEYIIEIKNFIKNGSKYIPKYIKFKSPHISFILQSINLLEWAKSHKTFKYPKKYTHIFASKTNDLDIIKYLDKDNIKYNNNLMIEAAKNGNKDILKWGLNKGLLIDNEIAAEACGHGDLNIVKWILKKYDETLFDALSWNKAAENGNLHILKFLNKNCTIKFESDIFYYVTRGGSIRCLKYLFYLSVHDLSLPFFNLKAYYGAIENGDLRMIKWLKKHYCPWDSSLLYRAIDYDKIDIFKWVVENGCPMDNNLKVFFNGL
jgi:hypothetical protein